VATLTGVLRPAIPVRSQTAGYALLATLGRDLLDAAGFEPPMDTSPSPGTATEELQVEANRAGALLSLKPALIDGVRCQTPPG
jgi:hypothetical protein